MANGNATVHTAPVDKVFRFLCKCGEIIFCEYEPGKRVRPVCGCGRAWLVTYSLLRDGYIPSAHVWED